MGVRALLADSGEARSAASCRRELPEIEATQGEIMTADTHHQGMQRAQKFLSRLQQLRT